MGRTHPGRTPVALAFLTLLAALLASGAGEPPRPADELPPPGAGARSDTLFLFAAEGPGSYGSPGTDARGFTFDGPAGEAAPAGWQGVDKTVQPTHWQLASTSICAGTGTDMSPALPFDPEDAQNDCALWCGGEDPCWSDPAGYGNDWYQFAVLDLTGHPLSDTLRLDFAFRSDFEGGYYDYFAVDVKYGEGPLRWDGVYIQSIASDRTYRELSVSIPRFEFGDQADRPRVAFRFFSDGGWSDEDGSYLSNLGAVWIDNVRASVDGVEVFAADFEDGALPPEISFLAYPATGDYAGLYAGLYQGSVQPANDSFVWACFDSLTPAWNAPGYEFGIVWGKPYLNDAIESPFLSVDAAGQPLLLGPATHVILQADVYRDLPLNDLIFFYWELATRSEGSDCLGHWENNNQLYYGDGARWDTWTIDLTESLWESAGGEYWNVEAIGLRLAVRDMEGIWGYGETEHRNQAPYFDNIRLMLVEGDLTAAPAVPAAHLALSAQPNPFNPATELRFSASAGTRVQLAIHDLAGRCVAILLDGPATGDEQRVQWNGRDAAGRALPTGVYLARLQAGEAGAAIKLLLIK